MQENFQGVGEMKKAILVLGKGDNTYSDRNRVRFVKYAKKAGFDVQESDYHELKNIREFKNEKINVMLFFPYTFWNANCEVPNDKQLYGTSREAYEKFSGHFLQVQEELGQKFNGHSLHYVIPPEKAFIDRDKIETMRILRQEGVPTPEPAPYNSLEDIVRSVSRGRGVFIKCRYGAEGKGITVLHHDKWVTNYKVDGDRLANYDVYGLWPFTDIIGRKDLLGQLLQNDVIVEREILTANAFDGKKFDMRLYVINQEVPHLFVRLNDPKKEVTNYSQGAAIKYHPETGLDEACLRMVRKIAKKAANAMGLLFVAVDIMFDGNLKNAKVVEAQAFADFPDIRKFNLTKYIVSDKSGLFV